MLAGAAVVAFACAVAPRAIAPHLTSWDKADHFITFFVLTSLAAASFPAGSLMAIGAVMSAFGGLIELVQGLPFVGRDCDIHDWVADSVAVLAVIAAFALFRRTVNPCGGKRAGQAPAGRPGR